MSKFTKQKTALIIGRWQPWHKGHRELFKAALERAERVAIGVRHTFATDGKNPFSFDEVRPGDNSFVVADNTLASWILNWVPKRSIDDICRES